jgi:hypothetical protein
MSNFMKIRPVGAELLHAHRWTDRETDRQTDTHNEVEFFESAYLSIRKNLTNSACFQL